MPYRPNRLDTNVKSLATAVNRRVREKVFQNHEMRVPLYREAKVRIMHFARCLKRRIEERKHYGVLTAKFVDVLHALVVTRWRHLWPRIGLSNCGRGSPWMPGVSSYYVT